MIETITTPSAAAKKLISTEFAKMKHKRQLLSIFILLLICIIGWGVITLFSSQKTSKIDPELVELAKPLSPVIDTEIFAILEQKRLFTDEELQKFAIYRIYVDAKAQKEIVISIDEEVKDPNTSN